MKKLMSITVCGKTKTWSFNFYGDKKDIKEWREDGLEIDEICSIIPEWVVNFGLTKVWRWLQKIRLVPLD
jgi:hypothetical protein